MRWLLSCVLGSGCAIAADTGAIQHQPGRPIGASTTAHLGFGGAGKPYMLAFQLDTRIDIASGGSRWAAGGSALGGLAVGPAHVDARAGVWRAIVSGTDEASIVPSFELGGYVQLRERHGTRPEYGASTDGIVFGVRDDLDSLNYVTVFVGYALFIFPGY